MDSDRRCHGGTALRDFPCHRSRAQPLGGHLRLFEDGPCALEVLGPAAGDKRSGPAGVGAGEEQRCTEPLVDLGGGGEVAFALIGALQGCREGAERPGDRAVYILVLTETDTNRPGSNVTPGPLQNVHADLSFLTTCSGVCRLRFA